MNTVSITGEENLKKELQRLNGTLEDDGFYPKAMTASASIKAMHEFMQSRAEPIESPESNPYVKGNSGGGSGGGGGSGCAIL